MLTEVKKFLQKPKLTSFNKIHRFSVPKTPYSYRQVTWIDLPDLLKYSAAVFSIADTIESARIPISEKVVFSYRYQNTGPLLNKSVGYNEFRSTSESHSKSGKFQVKITTDISNFYDRLNLHRLESILAAIDCSKTTVRFLNQLLLFWADRNSYGIPVGCDASRILAEASLIGVDNALRRRNICFVRYVDDYRIFAETFAQGHSHLNSLVELLDAEGLFINTSKTAFIDLRADSDNAEDENKSRQKEFERIDEQQKEEVHLIMNVGYQRRILKHYRFPGKERIEQLKTMNLKAMAAKIVQSPNENVEDQIAEAVKVFIYQGGADHQILFSIVDRYIHSLSYIVDGLLKEKERLSDAARLNIRQEFKAFCEKHTLSPYYRLTILRLLCSDGYLDREYIKHVAENVRVGERVLFLREFVLFTRPFADRELLLIFRGYYDSCAVPIRRTIFHLFMNSTRILRGEKRAWCMSLRVTERDKFILQSVNDFLQLPGGENEASEAAE